MSRPLSRPGPLPASGSARSTPARPCAHDRQPSRWPPQPALRSKPCPASWRSASACAREAATRRPTADRRRAPLLGGRQRPAPAGRGRRDRLRSHTSPHEQGISGHHRAASRRKSRRRRPRRQPHGRTRLALHPRSGSLGHTPATRSALPRRVGRLHLALPLMAKSALTRLITHTPQYTRRDDCSALRQDAAVRGFLRGRFVPMFSPPLPLFARFLGAVPARGGFGCEAAGHEVDHREVNHGFGAVGVGFVVAGRAARVHQPAQRSLDGPPPGQDGESSGGGVV